MHGGDSLDDAGAPPPTQTAVIVTVPAAEPVVGEHRRGLDRAARWGVPAHVTVLYPFVPPEAVDGPVVAALAGAVASVEAFDCTFGAVGWFGDDVLWLAPEPSAPFRALTGAVWRAFPRHAPYGGIHDDVVPHLTVAERALGGRDAVRAAAAALPARLPVRQRVDHALLVAGSSAPRSWRTLCRLPLGG